MQRGVTLDAGGAGTDQDDVGQIAQGGEDPVVAGCLQTPRLARDRDGAVDAGDEVHPHPARVEPVPSEEFVHVYVWIGIGRWKESLHGINQSTARRCPPGVERGLDAVLDRALALAAPGDPRLRRSVASATRGRRPASAVRAIERRYQAAVSAIGAASGGAAAVPGVGTAAALATGLAEIAAFVEATALYTLATAEVYGISTDDPEVRRALVLAVLARRGRAWPRSRPRGSRRRIGRRCSRTASIAS